VWDVPARSPPLKFTDIIKELFIMSTSAVPPLQKLNYKLPIIDIILMTAIVIGVASLTMLLIHLTPLFKNNDPVIYTLGLSGLFLAITLAIALGLALITSISKPIKLPTPQKIRGLKMEPGNNSYMSEGLNINKLLLGEFGYARETAAQAMEERRMVINFYLLIVGGAGSGAVAILFGAANPNRQALLIGAVILLWIVCLIGWLSLFMLISLRLAWVGSANSMNYIKEFYLNNAENMGMDLSSDVIHSAFYFKSNTLPSAKKHWNATHYSALLVALLDSAAFWGGTILLGINL
jgi:hypothetical protein